MTQRSELEHLDPHFATTLESVLATTYHCLATPYCVHLLYDDMSACVGWLVEAEYRQDFYTIGWINNVKWPIDTFSRPNTREYGYTADRAEAMYFFFFEFVKDHTELTLESFIWVLDLEAV
jgi:hypothetical protein